LILDAAGIGSLIDSMSQEAKQITSEVLKLCWYMRGGLTYTEAMNMSNTEREVVANLVKENLETTKKSGLPFF
jgi:hypothetical protein